MWTATKIKTEDTFVDVIKEKKISHGVIQLRSDNILVFRPDVHTFKEYDLDILIELREHFIEITDGIPRPYMADNRHITGIVTKEEKEYIHKHAGDFATKMAALTHSPIMKVMLNSYVAMFKPKMKMKLFSKEEEAVDWLTSNGQ
ncbi:MAG: hypothetical protein ACFHU9_08380 [Fluviicola sp.]